MSAPNTRLLSNARAAEIEARTTHALLRFEVFTETGRELARAANVLLLESAGALRADGGCKAKVKAHAENMCRIGKPN